MNIRTFFAAIVLAFWALSAAAVPTVDEVQAEVQQGHYAHAESMMQEVVAARPGSARAHYVLAEVLAHNKHFDQASQEVARARELDPKLGFADPAKFKAFQQLLERDQSAAAKSSTTPTLTPTPALPAPRVMPREEPSSGLPGWLWGLIFAGGAVLLWRLFSRRAQAPAAMGMPMSANPSYGPGGQAYGPGGPGYGAPGAMGGGSGMLGTGIAAAGGFAAGMLAEKLFDGRHDNGSGGGVLPSSAGAGGLVPGMFDDAPSNDAARELEQRDVDFGSGDGWGGGDAGGSSGSSDDGGW